MKIYVKKVYSGFCYQCCLNYSATASKRIRSLCTSLIDCDKADYILRMATKKEVDEYERRRSERKNR